MIRPLMLAAAVSLSLAAPVQAQDSGDATADTVIARVGDVEITLGHVIVMRRQLPEQYQQLPDNVLFEGIVEQLVDQYLLSQEAPTGEDMPKTLMLRLENERRAMLAASVIQETTSVEISDADLQAAYDEQIASAPREKEYNASHILVAEEDEAKAIVEELAGGADFAELAKEKSTGPSGPNGGDLGWFGTGRMVPEFETAVLGLEVGAVSEPVQTQFGWHVITLNEVRDVALPTLEEARGELETGLRQKALEDRIAGLREAAGVEMLGDSVPVDAFRNDALLEQ